MFRYRVDHSRKPVRRSRSCCRPSFKDNAFFVTLQCDETAPADGPYRDSGPVGTGLFPCGNRLPRGRDSLGGPPGPLRTHLPPMPGPPEAERRRRGHPFPETPCPSGRIGTAPGRTPGRNGQDAARRPAAIRGHPSDVRLREVLQHTATGGRFHSPTGNLLRSVNPTGHPSSEARDAGPGIPVPAFPGRIGIRRRARVGLRRHGFPLEPEMGVVCCLSQQLLISQNRL